VAAVLEGGGGMTIAFSLFLAVSCGLLSVGEEHWWLKWLLAMASAINASAFYLGNAEIRKGDEP
jgi:hypothetical protein